MTKQTIFIPTAITALMLAYMSIFYVGESEKAIKFRLGEIINSDYQPGIHFKFPLINNVNKFDARVLTLNVKPERFLTMEKKNVIVDSFAKWKIGNAFLFYTTVGADPMEANLRLDQIIKDAMRSEFGVRTIKQLISEDRARLRQVLMTKLLPVAEAFGIELIEIRIKRIDLPDKVSSSVYRRMKAERQRVAREFRSQGSEQAETIRAIADKKKNIIVAESKQNAEVIRGRGDAQAASIYARSYTRDEEFYAFYRSLSAYEASFEKTQDTLILEPKSDFFKYFSNEN